MVAFLPTKKVAFLVVLGPVDVATGKTPIENVDHRRASPADGRPIRQPDNNSGQRHTEIILETTANGYNDLHSLWRKPKPASRSLCLSFCRGLLILNIAEKSTLTS